MTVIRPNSVAGINSITVQSGNSLAVHKANGELIRTLTSSSGVSTFSSISVGTAATDNSAGKSINIGLGASISQHNANTLSFGTGGDERALIDSSGRLMVGHNSSLAIGGGDNSPLQVSATSSVVFGGARYVNSSSGPFISLAKSRATTAGSNTIVQDGDELGTILFAGDDGTDLISKGAQIQGQVDGTPGSNDMPGRLVFYTTADGAASPTERLRITSVGIATFTETGTGNGMGGVVASTATGGGNAGFQWATNNKGRYQVTTIGSADSESLRVYDIQNAAERLRIDDSGRVLLGTTTEGHSNADDLTIATSGNTGITIRSGTSNGGNIFFSDATSGDGEYAGMISYDHNDNIMTFHGGGAGSERLRINSDGTLKSRSDINGQAIHKFQNLDATSSSSAMTEELHFNFGRSGDSSLDLSAARIVVGKEQEWVGAASNQDGFMSFFTCTNETPSEKVRINSAGALLINRTAQNDDELFSVFTSSTTPEMMMLRNNAAGSTKDMITMMHVKDSGTQTAIRFKRTGSLSNVGSITTESNSTAFNTSSDYRLKENAVLISDGIARLKTLKPYRFNFKTEPTKTVDGFFAHEVTAVPEAITGEKDAVETTYYKNGDTLPDGKVVGDVKEANAVLPQSLDYSKLTPLLTAALQEALTKIETLETKVAALEGG